MNSVKKLRMFNTENKNSSDNISLWIATISLGKRMYDNYQQIFEGLSCRKGIRTKTEFTEVQNFNSLYIRGGCLMVSLQSLKKLKELDWIFVRAIRRGGFCIEKESEWTTFCVFQCWSSMGSNRSSTQSNKEFQKL